MVRALANAVVVAGIAVPLCLYAQPRGIAPHSSFSRPVSYFRSYSAAPRVPVAPRPIRPAAPSVVRRPWGLPPAGQGSSLIGSGESACLLNPSYAGSFFCRQFFAGRASWGFEPLYPYWFPSAGYETEQPAPPPAVEQDSQVAAQVSNLAAEVEMLREDQARRDAAMTTAPAPPSEEEEKPPTTLFVYRDGHQLEAQNYAIMGQTLWVFSGQTTRRIPLADLNLPATRKLNEERGVEVTVPGPQ